MPQVQVLPQAPQFGERLIDQLQRVGGELGQAYQQGKARQALTMMSTQISQPGGTASLNPGNVAQIAQFAEKAYGPSGKAYVDALLQQQALSEKRSLKYLSENEKPLQELSENQQSLELQALRYGRLQELFKQPDKFPGSLTTALATDASGQIRPTFSSLLTPEAQESIKLIQDELSGARDTFGARVTNFDVQNYLRRLPSLINTAEGRDRVLRDLELINRLNRLRNQSILDTIDEAGGAGSMPLSSVQRLAEKRIAPIVSELKKEFVNPRAKKAVKSAESIVPEVKSEEQPSPTSTMKRVKAPDGRIVLVPEDQLDMAMKSGGILQ